MLQTMPPYPIIPHPLLVDLVWQACHSNLASLTRLAYIVDRLNYGSWASGFEDFLQDHNPLDHLTSPLPDTMSPTNPTWLKLDLLILSWMHHSISSTISESVVQIKLTQVLWKMIKTMYANKMKISCIAKLYESFFACK